MITMPKNSKEEFRLSIDMYHGRQLVNFRVWYRTDDGQMRPGKQGIAFRREMLTEVIEALAMFQDDEA